MSFQWIRLRKGLKMIVKVWMDRTKGLPLLGPIDS